MNKKKMRVIGSFVLIISLSFPMIIVGFQDFYDINKEISLENSQTEDILKEHPVIEGIYKFYQNSSTNSQEYVIKRKDEYTVKEQEKLLQLQTLFSGEIEKLMNHKILSHELLENEDEKYIADYGTLIDDENAYYLRQVLRMWQDSFKSFDYKMDPQTHKIIGFSMSQEDNLIMSDNEMKTMAWRMIEYLELDDIDDWVYNQYGYESNKAKLRISCEFEKRVDTNNININVTLLGVLRPLLYGGVTQN